MKNIIKPIETKNESKRVKEYDSMKKATDKVETYVRKHKRPRFGLKSTIFCMFLGVTLSAFAFMKISEWYDTHRVTFQTPVIFQSPVIIKKREEVQPVIKQKPKAVNINIKGSFDSKTGFVTAGMTDGQVALEAYKTVHFHETNNGKDKTGLNGYCIKLGLINEVGYDPQDNFCFKNETEQTATVINWFRNCLLKSSINQCLRLYSSNAYTALGY